uniref:Dynein heavy chain tail domain-containing protein n=1 Tax=Callorhinchus milii TaxID=7868 RepID=A0A4W3J9S6_CALMI
VEESFDLIGIKHERIDFIKEQVFQSLKLKSEKWNRFMAVEENQRLLIDFLDQGRESTHSAPVNPAGQRPNGVGLPDSDILFGAYHVLCLPSCICSQVLVPVLSNINNHSGWPQAVSQDLNKYMEIIRSNTLVIRGQVQGKTILALDCLFILCSLPQMDRAVLHSIESMVIQWTHQIADVMKQDSAHILLEELNPVPNAEIDFWTARKENMFGIYSQIQDPKVCKIATILKMVKSSYYSTFRDLTLRVTEAVSEAQDIELHLRPLKRHLAHLEEVNFSEVEPLIPPLFHTICLIWSHSKYYCFPPRIIVLLQEFCNLLINQALNYLTPEEIFKVELEEAQEKVRITIHILRSFKTCFHQHQLNISDYYSNSTAVKPWTFPPQLIFARLDRFFDRLLKIEELFVTATEFLKLEKIVIGGSKGKLLSEKVYSMNDEFQEGWRIFEESKYDPLDYTNMVLLCFKLFELYKLVTPVRRQYYLNMFCFCKYISLTSLFLLQLKSNCAALNKNMPHTAGNLKWSQELRERLLSQRNQFRHINHP